LGRSLRPGVDGLPGLIRHPDEINFLQSGMIGIASYFEKRRLKAIVLLSPQAIGDAELEMLVLPWVAMEIGDQFAETGVQFVVIEIEAERLFHFGSGVAARAGVRHGEGTGDAVRRVEKVARFVGEMLMQRKREISVAPHQCVDISLRAGRMCSENR